jgi:hypothetical protein
MTVRNLFLDVHATLRYLLVSVSRRAATVTSVMRVANSSFAAPCGVRSRARYLPTIVFVDCLSIPGNELLGIGGKCSGQRSMLCTYETLAVYTISATLEMQARSLDSNIDSKRMVNGVTVSNKSLCMEPS